MKGDGHSRTPHRGASSGSKPWTPQEDSGEGNRDVEQDLPARLDAPVAPSSRRKRSNTMLMGALDEPSAKVRGQASSHHSSKPAHPSPPRPSVAPAFDDLLQYELGNESGETGDLGRLDLPEGGQVPFAPSPSSRPPLSRSLSDEAHALSSREHDLPKARSPEDNLPASLDGSERNLPAAVEVDDRDLPSTTGASGSRDLPAPRVAAKRQKRGTPTFGTLDLSFSDLDDEAESLADTLVSHDEQGSAMEELPLPDLFDEIDEEVAETREFNRDDMQSLITETSDIDSEAERQTLSDPDQHTRPFRHVSSESSAAHKPVVEAKRRQVSWALRLGEWKRVAADRPRRLLVALAGGFFVLALVGGLALHWTHFGIFGRYFFERFHPAYGDAGKIDKAISVARQNMRADTYQETRRARRLLGTARKAAGLNPDLLAMSLMLESYYALRFDGGEGSTARLDVIFRRLEERGFPGRNIGPALALYHLRKGNLNEARSALNKGSGETTAVDRFFAQGWVNLMQSRANDAVSLFKKAAKGYGAAAIWGQAISELAVMPKQAVHTAEQLLEVSLAHRDARLVLASALAVNEKNRQAIALASEALHLPQENPEGKWRISGRTRAWANELLGHIYLRTGNAVQASQNFETAYKALPSQRALLGAGFAYLDQHRFEEALSRFESAIERRSDNPLTSPPWPMPGLGQSEGRLLVVGKARALLALDRPQEVLAMVKTEAAKYLEDLEVSLEIGEAEKATGAHKEAEQRFRSAIEKAPQDPRPYLAFASLLELMGRDGEADRVLENAAKKATKSSEMHRLMGATALRRGRFDEAAEQFGEAIRMDPEDLAARLGFARALRRLGKLEGAERALKELRREDSEYAGLALEEGLIWDARGNTREALVRFEAALESRPQDPEVLQQIVAGKLALGEPDGLDEKLASLAKLRPEAAEVNYLQGRQLALQHRPREALESFKRAVERDPTRATYHAYYASMQLQTGDLGAAIAAANKALRLDPTSVRATWVLGKVHLGTGAVRDAKKAFESCLELDAEWAPAYANLGECYDQLGRRREAIAQYERALQLDGKKGAWWHYLGKLRFDQDRRPEAISALRKAIALGIEQGRANAKPVPNWFFESYRLLGDGLRRGREKSEAKSAYQKYLDLAPEDAIDRRVVERRLAELSKG